VGETFTDAINNIAVIVNSDTGSGFEVTISNGDLPPVSDANGPYEAECQDSTTDLVLDGNGSRGPGGEQLSYDWDTDCPGGSFDDNTSPTPTLSVDSTNDCYVTCTVTLTVTDDAGLTDESESTVTVSDTTPPEIEGNAPAKIMPSDAPVSFTSTVTDNCDGDEPTVEITDYDCFTFTKKGKRIDRTRSCVVSFEGDTINIMDSGGVGDIITWTSVSSDECGNTTEFECTIDVVRKIKP
jgi:hypothetical protein